MIPEPVPACPLPAGLGEHPAADGGDQAGLFENGDEVVRLDDALGRMTPAQQGLNPGRRSAGQVEDRLVHQEVLLGHQGFAQVHLQEEAILHHRVHLRPEHDEAVLAGGLGPVERDIGIAEQLGGRRSGPACDPDAGCQAEWATERVFQFERLAQHRQHPLGHQFGAGVHGRAVDQDDELVTAEPSHAVALAHDAGQPGGHRLQESIADRVPERVVDLLEAVQIDEKGRHGDIVAPGPGQHLFGAVEDEGPVGQAGQRVVHGLEADLLHQLRIRDARWRLGRPGP